MRLQKSSILLASTLVTGLTFTIVAQTGSGIKSLAKAAYGDHCSEENKVHNVYRHPIQNLSFFDIQPHHTVVEVGPGSGCYTGILGPYLKDKGELFLMKTQTVHTLSA